MHVTLTIILWCPHSTAEETEAWEGKDLLMFTQQEQGFRVSAIFLLKNDDAWN